MKVERYCFIIFSLIAFVAFALGGFFKIQVLVKAIDAMDAGVWPGKYMTVVMSLDSAFGPAVAVAMVGYIISCVDKN